MPPVGQLHDQIRALIDPCPRLKADRRMGLGFMRWTTLNKQPRKLKKPGASPGPLLMDAASLLLLSSRLVC
jgi:hypothetical protein